MSKSNRSKTNTESVEAQNANVASEATIETLHSNVNETHVVEEIDYNKIKATYDVTHVVPAANDANGNPQMAVNLEGIGQVILPKIANRRTYATKIKGVGKILINIVQFKDTPGRMIDPTSERQQRLAKQNAKRALLEAQGITMGRGRNIDPNSERQKALRARAEKLTDDEVIAMQETEQYKKLKAAGQDEMDIRVAILGAGAMQLPRGRNVDLNSDRQKAIQKRVDTMTEEQREAVRELPKYEEYLAANDKDEDKAIQSMITQGELKGVFERGRPSTKANEVVEVEDALVLHGDEELPMVN